MNITVVGGGSYSWSFGFASQFVDSKHLKDVSLTLMDMNQGAVELVGAAAEKYNNEHGSLITIEIATDLEQSLKSADFVLVSISTGGFAAMKHDIEIPQKYGIWHTVGDTVGPGGLSRAVRNIPVFNDLAEKMKRLCPEAWLINVTNPLSVLTRVPQRNFGVKTIGMCPGVEGHARTMARLAGSGDNSRIDYTVTGIDHGSWYTKLYADGTDVLEKLKEMGYCRSDGHLPRDVKTDDPLAEDAASRAIFAVWKEMGFLPSIADRHAVENWPWFLVNETGELPFKIKRTSIAEREIMLDTKRKRIERYIREDDRDLLKNLGHGKDPVLEVIESLSGYRSFVWGSNFMNIGQIPGFPNGAVVETRCLFDAAGVHPLCSPMPDLLKTIVLPQVLRQEAVIDIALSGTFDEFAALVFTDPLCCGLAMGTCREMVREMLDANREYIQNPGLLEF